MKEWYLALSVVGRVYFYIAIAASVLLIVQIVLMIFSFAGATDIDGDGIPDGADVDLDNGLCIFTVKSVTAFFAIGAWVGLAFLSAMPEKAWLAILMSVISGGIAMVLVALVLKWFVRLQCNGNVSVEKLVGLDASVYVAIQPKRSGRGKVTLNAQGRFMELDAVTDENEALSYGECVVISSMENGTAVVKRKIPE